MIARKAMELRLKLDGLRAEFGRWRDWAAPKKPGAKHHTQIERLTGIIGHAADNLAGNIEKAVASGAHADRWMELERQILELHRVWEFFRSKLTLRHVPWTGASLAAADDFAWACYDAARGIADPAVVPAAAVREPPLVFFSGRSSPFTWPRGWQFLAESVPASEGADSPMLAELVRQLPISVIGAPWFQADFAPESLVVAHEVGHDVQHDFGLTAALEAIVRAVVPTPQAAVWLDWLGEIFADLYGVVVAGPAFATTLGAFLFSPQIQAVTQSNLRVETPYPPLALRLLLVRHALRERGFHDAADVLDREQKLPGILTDYADASKSLVAELLSRPLAPFGQRPLKDVSGFAAGHWDEARRASGMLLAGMVPQNRDVRVLMAAGAEAFREDPSNYYKHGVGNLVLLSISAARDEGTRTGAAGADRDIPAEGEAFFRSLTCLFDEQA